MAFSTSRGGVQIIQQPPQTTLLKKYTDLNQSLQNSQNYGAAVYIDDDGSLNLAKANIWQNAQTVGVVQGGYTANGMWHLEIVYQGEITFPNGATSTFLKFPLVTGDTYYLSTGLSGGLTGAPPSTSTVVQPMMVATDSYSGIVVNGLPAASVLLGNTQVSIFSPVGSVMPFMGTPDKVPGNYLLCVGDSFPKGTTSSDTYNDLYSSIGEKYSILGLIRSGTTGTTGYVRFDGSVDDAALISAGSPGSTKNHSLANNQVYKMVWGTKEAVVKVYSATGASTDVTFQFLQGITGWAAGASSFSGLVDGTEIYLKSLKTAEVSGYTSDNFFVPDLRGRALMGAGKGRGLTAHTLGEMGGEETHLLTSSEIPSHSHEIPIRSNVAGGAGSIPPALQQTIGSGVTASGVNSLNTNVWQANKALSLPTGGAEAHQNLPPYISANWIIRYKSNKGNPGVEVGPQGPAGAQGITGLNGGTGPTGSTGYSLGTLSYRYGSNSTVSSGYFYYDTVAKILYINSTDIASNELSPLFDTWGLPTSFTKGTLYIRDAVTLNAIRVLGIVTAPAKVGSVYRMNATVDLGGSLSFTSGRLYNLIWVPSGNKGTDGVSITGPTGIGTVGATGNTGATGPTGACVCPVDAWGDSSVKTVYLNVNGVVEQGGGNVFPNYFSGEAGNPTNWLSWTQSTQGKYTAKRSSPINLSRLISNSVDTSFQVKRPCGGNDCDDSSQTVSLLYQTAASNTLEKIKAVGLVLSSGQYTINNPILASNGNYFICAESGSYQQIDPDGLSASNSGNTITIDITSDISNVAVGDYLSLTSETFAGGISGFTGSDTYTGSNSLCGLYTVTSIDTNNGIVRANGIVANGASGASVFSGYIPSGNLGYYNVYKTSVVFNNTDGFIVDPSATLTLGKTYDGTGNPFVIVFANGTSGGAASKAVICDGGKVNMEAGMAIYGTPINGAGIYSNGGRVVADRVVASKNGVAVYAENSSVTLKSPTLAQNTTAIVANRNGLIDVVGLSGATYDYTVIANNRTAGVVSATTVDVSDPRFHLLISDYQQGILATNQASVSIAPGTTSSYSSVISGYLPVSGLETSEPKPVVIGMVDSNYRIVSNRLAGLLSVTGGFLASSTSLTGNTTTISGPTRVYPNQDLSL